MNVYEKLAQLRDDVQKANLKKTGYNKHLNYHYYELGDFMPFVINKMVLYKLFSNVSFGKLDDSAVLEILNIEEPTERSIFTSPMSTANLANCHPVQNLGATQTYIRRYLWTSALELTDGDAIENNTGNKATVETQQKPVQPTKPAEQPKAPEPQQNATKEQPVVNEAQIKRLYAICKEHGKNQDQLKAYMMEKYGFDSSKKLTKPQYDETCLWAEGK